MNKIKLKFRDMRYESAKKTVIVSEGKGTTMAMTTNSDSYSLEHAYANVWQGHANGHVVTFIKGKTTALITYI